MLLTIRPLWFDFSDGELIDKRALTHCRAWYLDDRSCWKEDELNEFLHDYLDSTSDEHRSTSEKQQTLHYLFGHWNFLFQELQLLFNANSVNHPHKHDNNAWNNTADSLIAPCGWLDRLVCNAYHILPNNNCYSFAVSIDIIDLLQRETIEDVQNLTGIRHGTSRPVIGSVTSIIYALNVPPIPHLPAICTSAKMKKHQNFTYWLCSFPLWIWIYRSTKTATVTVHTSQGVTYLTLAREKRNHLPNLGWGKVSLLISCLIQHGSLHLSHLILPARKGGFFLLIPVQYPLPWTDR